MIGNLVLRHGLHAARVIKPAAADAAAAGYQRLTAATTTEAAAAGYRLTAATPTAAVAA